MLLLCDRIDGLVPSTPGTAKLNKSSSLKKRPLETPSISRAKAGHVGSSPDSKTPSKLGDQLNSMGAIP